MKTRDGRLGNRMFMIASAYGLARLHSCHLYLTQEVLNDINTVFISNFSSLLLSSTTFYLLINKPNPMIIINKSALCEYFPELTRPNAIPKGQIFELVGYWHSYLHFMKYSNELRQNIFIATPSILENISHFFVDIYERNFHFKPQLSFHNHHIFKQQLINLKQTVLIGIHIRRGDFIDAKYSSLDEYVFTAIQYFTEYYTNAQFIVASDEKSYCRNLFRNRSNIFITPDSFSAGDDLITLSLCKHSIVTGGTFGWWSAFLTNGRVMHDKIFPSGCQKREHYYPPWFLIDGYVRASLYSNYTL
jgi:galactoside 2-L-fucosyltransferase 1/2